MSGCAVLVMLGWSLLWGVALTSSAQEESPRASPLRSLFVEAHLALREDEPTRAVRAAASCVARAPRKLACQAVHGRALAALGRCEEATARLGPLRGGAHWGPEEAASEARCFALAGQTASAEAALEEASALGVARTELWWSRQAFLTWMDAGEHTRAEALIGSLRDDARWAMAWLAVAGAAPGAEVLVEAMEDPADPRVAWLRCWRALDTDDPEEAIRASEGARPGGEWWLRGLACKAEGLRRLGLTEEVLRMDQRGIVPREAVWWRWVVARVWVDLGRPDLARATLPEGALSSTPEAAATAWYVARAIGDEAMARRALVRWAALGRGAQPEVERWQPLRRPS